MPILGNIERIKSKILLVHYGYPPQHTTGGIRLHKLYHHLKFYFNEVYTIPLYTKTKTYNQSSKNSKIAQLLIRLRHCFPTNLIFGKDHFFYFLITLYHAQKTIQKNNIQYILTSYQPISDHLVGLILKSWNPNLYWIADFRDPYPEEVKTKILFPKIQFKLFYLIQKNCNIITVVSKGLKMSLNQSKHKAFLLYNGLDKRPKGCRIPNLNKNFNGLIAYTGSLYPKIVNPSPLLKTLKYLFPKSRFLYMGKDAETWNNWLKIEGPSSIIHSINCHSTAKKIQHKAQILLLFTWSKRNARGILTTKLFEYLSTGKLVIIFIQGKNDPEWEEIARIFKNCILFYSKTFQSKELRSKLKRVSGIKVKYNYHQISTFLWSKNIANFITLLKASNGI